MPISRYKITAKVAARKCLISNRLIKGDAEIKCTHRKWNPGRYLDAKILKVYKEIC